MDKSLLTLIGAVSVLAVPAANAATAVPANIGEAMHASSYADLLKPVPNALALLKASTGSIAPAQQSAAGDIEAAQLTLQFGPRPRYHHHHHHHHHHYYRRYSRHHHHHHRFND